MRIYGTAGNDLLTDTRDEASVLNAGWSAGEDTMIGGSRDDTYFVNSAGDVVIETAGGGRDRVMLLDVADFRLPDQVEVLTLLFGARDATGNASDNVIYGNHAANHLEGGGGTDVLDGGAGDDALAGGAGVDFLHGGRDDDTLFGGDEPDLLYGESGLDTLFGGAGNDVLDGGTGGDTMAGQQGADAYYVDSAGDVVEERWTDVDVDTVIASASFSIRYTAVENVTLTGDAADVGGNRAANRIIGNERDNTLNGDEGDDTLGGNGGADDLRGGYGVDTLAGGAGSDVLTGGPDADHLRGGADRDYFVFDRTGTAHADAIEDFSGADHDMLLLRWVVSPEASELHFGTLLDGGRVRGQLALLDASSLFHGAVNGSRPEHAQAGIYVNDATGELWLDVRGSVHGDEHLLGTMAPEAAAGLAATDVALWLP